MVLAIAIFLLSRTIFLLVLQKEEGRKKNIVFLSFIAEERRKKEEGKILFCLSFKLSICPNLFLRLL
ncbi:MAG: hypothetical protein F6K48_17550 [Okeania sp. SIO3H1]|uniref:hypothetical protein n=1 Tax=Okeania sp. SIO1I7 TaxID=2607772 RepID=UPI0013C711FA|nr:hypothetical protein [Okeania sp. SIO1I7]NEN90614.1 hypothetical protein [Okeania sp. SIO3H1]NET29926.1 hypothetical protein [Okeania sp. SIO1I7]